MVEVRIRKGSLLIKTSIHLHEEVLLVVLLALYGFLGLLQLVFQNLFLLIKRCHLIAHNGTIVVKCRKDASKLFVSLTYNPVIMYTEGSHHDKHYHNEYEYHDEVISIR